MNDTTRKPPKIVGDYEIHLTGQGRQFKNDFMEKFGRCHGLTPLFVYVPVVAYCLYLALTDTAQGVGSVLTWTAAGVFVWTLTEYWLHRKLFHWKKWPQFHYFIHGIHHVYPNDRGRMVMPPGASASFAVPFWFIFYFACGYAIALPFFAGFVIGYLWYDMTHYWTHVGKARSAWGKLIRKQHMLHHFNTPEHNFGVTSPAWDMVFGTYKPEKDKG